ncbi:MAG: DUF4071 domain-containing protein [Elusimicrobia bacterium]|nr:DUF4071 domain-containing protein [Elusimicrobiota bacterium]
MDRYRPSPIDAAGVKLPGELERLGERLARDTHENWAKERLAQGWTFGPRRDDGRKRHPCLVPYERLPESEKHHDRAISTATLKAIVSLGFRIVPPEASGGTCLAEAAVREGERVLRSGEPLRAYDILSQGLESSPGHVRLRQLVALSLARSGATERAGAAAQALVEEGHRDEETLALLARTYKDRRQWKQALRWYSLAYRLHKKYYAGINVASLLFLTGRRAKAAAVAAKVRRSCAGGAAASDYWAQATLGEAALLLGRWDEAAQRYAAASKLAQGRWTDIGSMRRQARLLCGRLPAAAKTALAALAVPAVAWQLGGPPGRSGRGSARLRAAAKAALLEAGAGFVYASAVSDADLDVLEAAADLGLETQAVIPCPADRLPAALGLAARHPWSRRLRKVLGRVSRLHVANEFAGSLDPVQSRYCALILEGLASLRAESLGAGTVRLGGKSPLQGGMSAARPGPRLMALLFADVVGFSKLREEGVPRFVTDFLGSVGKLTAAGRHRPVMRNTWGDALYLVFRTVEEAGRYALALAERVGREDWTRHGLPGTLSFRIALHAGPVFECIDPVSAARNYVGTHVSRAARIEPITPPGQVYGSQAFAALAAAQGARGFSCEYVGQVPLAKKYGSFPLYHVRKAGRPARACRL